MSIDITDTARVISYVATAGQTVFAVPFEFFEDVDLQVSRNSVVASLSASPSSADQYIVSRNPDGTGSIALGAGATLGDAIEIKSNLAIQRTTNFPTSGQFPIGTLNDQLAKLVIMIADRQLGVDENATEISTVLQLATALSASFYTSIALGLAGTNDGDEFAVDNGDGTATVYSNNSGSEVEIRTIILDPADSDAAALIGAQGGTVQSRLTAALGHGTTVYTVATLPAVASQEGAFRRAFVSDSSVVASGNFGAVVVGGGANTVPVYADGANWRIG